MKILAYDSSSDVLNAALFEGSKKLAESTSPLFTRHSSVLAPTLEKLLKKQGWKMEKVECIAVGLGPGSFTGLRVGLTTAKIIAYATGARLVGVPSLEILAVGAKASSGRIAVMLDAKKERVYAAIYKKNASGSLQIIQAPILTDAKSFLKKAGESAIIIGGDVFPKASDLAAIALERIQQKKFNDPFKLEPLYLHPRDCNVTKNKR